MNVLFLSQQLNSTLLFPVIAVASQSLASSKDIMKQTLQSIGYEATQEEAVLTYVQLR